MTTSTTTIPPSRPPTATTGNEALTPLGADHRRFGWFDHAALWLSLGVGLLVMQVGAYLVPALGTRDAMLMIVVGSIVGAGVLGWTARIGCDTGLASAGLMHATYGSAFARLPIVLNIVQLIGWTTFELVVMRDGTVAIARQAFGIDVTTTTEIVATVVWGAVLLALISGSMVTLVRRFVARFGLPLVLISLVWLSWQFASRAMTSGWDAFWNRPGAGGMSAMAALDLVIAMPISWLPLVADFSRHGHNGRAALAGTWVGYAIANIWCYGLGVLVALSLPGADLVSALLLAQGGLIALGLILIDEVDNAYGDVYSGSMAGHSLLPRWSARRWGMVLAGACAGLALILPMHSLEPFLLMLSSVFVPLYGVIIGRMAGRSGVVLDTEDAGAKHGGAVPGGAGGDGRRVDRSAVLIWVSGVIVYHALSRLAPAFGAAVPTLVATFVVAWATRRAGGDRA